MPTSATVTVTPVPPVNVNYQFNVTMSDSNVYEFFFSAIDQNTAIDLLTTELTAIITATQALKTN